jgi:SAM-dependent methyltransferase
LQIAPFSMNRVTGDPSRRPQWQLPAGVPRGVWEYSQAQHIAEQYDEYFSQSPLFAFDEEVLGQYFRQPGLVIDLGCGTGRALVSLARRGFPGLGVDLSLSMLRIVADKARQERLPIATLQANLVELDCIADSVADYATCLFSTLGMIRGRSQRVQFLRHVRRILKRGGLLVVHVHSFWHNLYNPLGRRWLLTQAVNALRHRDVQWGDKFFTAHGIAQMFLHTFRQGEFVGELRRAGFTVSRLIRIDVDRQRPLRHPWWFGRLRAAGWIAVCQAGNS